MAPFAFTGCIEVVEILNDRARDERELMERLERVPAAAVYCHTHSMFLRNPGVSGFANDFARWVATEIGDHVLAERLAVVDPFRFPSLEALRDEFLGILERHLATVRPVPRVVFGEPFCFIQAHVVGVPTGHVAHTLAELRDCLAAVDASALYYHLLDARARRQVPGGDLARWIGEDLGRSALAESLSGLNLYLGGLERIRAEILQQLDAELAAPGEPR
ncbi:MAG: hypothetical protein HY614_03385 [Candidatus Rokubacteria bacterium]|nr:hypothetical protein [Candidatus Rokubacteria bacterium]